MTPTTLIPPPTVVPPDNTGSKKSWRLALRMALHDLRRHKGRTAITMLLVILPVTTVMGFVTYLNITSLSATQEHGYSQLVIKPEVAANQSDQDSSDAATRDAGTETRADLLARLQESTGASWTVKAHQVGTHTDPNDIVKLTLINPELGTAGTAGLTTGRWPTAPDELVVTHGGARFGATVGDTLTLAINERPEEFTIVGTGFGSHHTKQADFLGLIDMTSPNIYTTTWLMDPAAPCTEDIVETVRRFDLPMSYFTGVCLPDSPPEPDGSTPVATPVKQQLASAMTKIGMMFGLPALLLGLLLAPSFSLSMLSQQQYFKRLHETGATPGQRQLIAFVQALIYSVVGGATGVVLALAGMWAVVAVVRQPTIGWWHLRFHLPSPFAYLVIIAVAMTCAVVAVLVAGRTLPGAPTVRSQWRALLLPVAVCAAPVLFILVAIWLGDDPSGSALVAWSAGAAMALVVTVIAGIMLCARIFAKLTGWHGPRHMMMLCKMAPQTMAFLLIAVTIIPLGTIQATILTWDQDYSSPTSLRSTAQIQVLTPSTDDIEPAQVTDSQWQDATATVRQHLPETRMAPLWRVGGVQVESFNLALVDNTTCRLQPGQPATPRRESADGCLEQRNNYVAGIDVAVLRTSDAQSLFNLTDDEATRFANGAVIVEGKQAYPHLNKLAAGHTARSSNPEDFVLTPQWVRPLDIIHRRSPAALPSMVLSRDVVEPLQIPVTFSALLAWHPTGAIGQADVDAINLRHDHLLANPTPQISAWPTRAVILVGMLATVGVLFFSFALLRRHFDRMLRSIRDVGSTNTHVAALPALLAASLCLAGLLIAGGLMALLVSASLWPSRITTDPITEQLAAALPLTELAMIGYPYLLLPMLTPLLVGGCVFWNTHRQLRRTSPKSAG